MVTDTSLLAFMDLLPELSERQLVVYRAIETLIEATDQEIKSYLQKADPNFVRPRRKELFDLGVVYCVGKRTCNVTKKTVYVWSVNKNRW